MHRSTLRKQKNELLSYEAKILSVVLQGLMKQQVVINCEEGGLPRYAALQMKHYQPQLFAMFS
ncbi:hypothetical protein PSKAS_48150 [Peribacillus sp. N1]